MTMAVYTSKVRICQDLFNAVSGRGINEDTDTLAVPACKIGHALRNENFVLHGVAVVNAAEKWLRDPTISPGWRPLCSAPFFLQPPSRILISDASGNGKGSFCLESGWWWRIDFTEDIRTRLRKRVCSRDDLSMNVFELLGMVVTASAMTVHAGARPEYLGQSMLMRRDNMSAVHWVRQEQHLGQGALDLASVVLASSSLEGPLRNRLNAITRQVPGLGTYFVG